MQFVPPWQTQRVVVVVEVVLDVVVVVVGAVVVVELVVLLVVVDVVLVLVVVVLQAVQVTSQVSWPAIVGSVQPQDGSRPAQVLCRRLQAAPFQPYLQSPPQAPVVVVLLVVLLVVVAKQFGQFGLPHADVVGVPAVVDVLVVVGTARKAAKHDSWT